MVGEREGGKSRGARKKTSIGYVKENDREKRDRER